MNTRYKIEEFTVGMDNEYLVTYKGIPTSGIGLVGGTKKRPLSIGRGCGRQEDNVAAEVTMPPVTTKEDLLFYVNYTKTTIEEILGEGYELVPVSSAEFSKEELDTPGAREFGCDPSFCIYTGGFSERKEATEVGNLRTFGAHIHIGWEGTKPIEEIERIVRIMDLMITVPSMLIDTDTRRREIYGNAGDFRFKPYGFEIRTLGSGMIASDAHVSFLWEQIERSISLFNKGFDPKPLELLVMKAIDESCFETAQSLCEQFEIKTNLINKVSKIVENANK